MPDAGKKYVVVLAHADGWGALSANKLLKHLHEHYPDLGVHLIVSQATKNKEGEIATKLADLKPVRALKETQLLKYFKKLDAQEEGADAGKHALTKIKPEPELLTFKRLAEKYCTDHEVHYTTSGGTKGGDQVREYVETLEKEYGHGPEVMLSVDTMAFVPKDVLEKYHCFSTHPGPLGLHKVFDPYRVKGMQGTLRSLVYQVLYGEDGMPLQGEQNILLRKMTGESTFVKGTLFLQVPELDKGPPITNAYIEVSPTVSAYQLRDQVYNALINDMIDHLPTFLDTEKRHALVERAKADKHLLDQEPHIDVAELEAGIFATWQKACSAMPDTSTPTGARVIQNQIVDPNYFAFVMSRFHPGTFREFLTDYKHFFAAAEGRIKAQKDAYIHEDHWATFAQGDEEVTIRQMHPAQGKVRIFNNRIPVLNCFHPIFHSPDAEGDIDGFYDVLTKHLGGYEAVQDMMMEELKGRLHYLLEVDRPADLMSAMPEAFREFGSARTRTIDVTAVDVTVEAAQTGGHTQKAFPARRSPRALLEAGPRLLGKGAGKPSGEAERF